MKNNDILSLRGHLRGTLTILKKMEGKYQDFTQKRSGFPPGSGYDLIVLAEIISDVYTCLETFFVRVSKAFENHLEKEKWHSSLLDKMIIEIPGVRKALLSDKTYSLLGELMRFRHFKRYYFELEYDKDKLDFLEKKLIDLFPLISEEIEKFDNFLIELEEN